MAQAAYVEQDSFERDTDYIADRITRDGRDGWPVEPGRYRLVAARACPWATRSIIVRSLLGLEDVISLGLAAPVHDERSWTFDLDPGGRDPVLGIHWLRDAYEKRFPGYDKGVTVPAMVDVPSGRVVTNDFPRITHDLFFEWADHHRDGAPDLWPEAVRDEMEEVMERHLHRRQRRRVPLRVRGVAALLRAGVRRALRRAGLAGGAPPRPALSDG
jgi:glutathionyl-hydroquinone reductase